MLQGSCLVHILWLTHAACELLQRLEGDLLLDSPLGADVHAAAVLHLLLGHRAAQDGTAMGPQGTNKEQKVVRLGGGQEE